MKQIGMFMGVTCISVIILAKSIAPVAIPVATLTPAPTFLPTPTPTLTATTILLPTQTIQPKPLVESYYHKQMDYGEYEGYFSLATQKYFGSNDIRKNFCGTATLLNVLDIMLANNNQPISGYNFVDIVNKYYIDYYGDIVNMYKNGDPASNPNGSMNFTAMYWLADKIGKDTSLWEMKLVHGSNDSTYHEPIKKSDLSYWVETTQKEVFSRGGIVIMDIGRNGGSDQIAYLHFITVLDMVVNTDGSAQMLIVDSMGTDRNGFYGWVNSEEYTTYGLKEYTGILNIYGVIPTGD